MSVMQESRQRTSDEKRALFSDCSSNGRRRPAASPPSRGASEPCGFSSNWRPTAPPQLALCRARAFSVRRLFTPPGFAASLPAPRLSANDIPRARRRTGASRASGLASRRHRDRRPRLGRWPALSRGLAEAHRPFALQTGPLFRGTVFLRSDCDYVLLFTVHHIIADYWSLVVLMSDLRQIFRPDHQAGGMHCRLSG